MTALVIFGGGGDLAWRKLIPSLYSLYLDHGLQDPFSILIVDRADEDTLKIRAHFLEGMKLFSDRNLDKWEEFSNHISYLNGDFKQVDTYQAIKKWLTLPPIFYLAVPPSLFAVIPKYLFDAGLTKNGKLVIEKPFGYDLESAKQLNASLLECFDESKIFRIDHYLGKETVQNILAFRFANPFFEPIWNHNYIDRVEILAAETVGVEHRGGYYDHSGALRDMVQNHLLQLLCLIAMEPIVSFEATEVRNKKVAVLNDIKPISPQAVCRGQYQGYREEEGVAKDSNTETYVELKAFIQNLRWKETPFYLRTGKKLAEHVTKISVHFKKVPHDAFHQAAEEAKICFLIQPDEEILIRFEAKYPGTEMKLVPVDMIFNYKNAFQIPTRDAYETLILDVIKNDSTLFMRADQVEAAWKILMPIIEDWKQHQPNNFPNYEPGSWGPKGSL